jgi:hypothetical protein
MASTSGRSASGSGSTATIRGRPLTEASVPEADAARDLHGLLAGAATAGPAERIEWRDPIAAHGATAIEAVRPWLTDPRLAAFAIRVIERAGRDGEREAAQSTLRGARRKIDPRVRPDLDWALLQLRTPATGPVPAAPQAARPARVAPAARPRGTANMSGASRRPSQASRSETS